MRPVTSPIIALVAALAASRSRAEPVATTAPTTPPAAVEYDLAASKQVFSALVTRLLTGAVPLEYDKQKDWGAVAEIPTGLRIDGKGFHAKLKKRTRSVNHGVWKHYRLRLIDPQKNLFVELVDVRPTGPGSVAYTLRVGATIDAWARAKVYHYGVHIIALEMEGDLRTRLTIDGELAVTMGGIDEAFAVALAPTVVNAKVEIDEFNLRRVSNAHGPIIRELGDGVRSILEEELNGPRLTEKLNRSIEKKRDRLTFRPAELFDSKGWPIEPTSRPGEPAAIATQR